MNRQAKILVVEDDKSLSMALGSKLTEEKYNVTVEDDGEKGLNSALKQHPDLIILDLIMPHMGGLEMLKRLRKDDWGVNVPVFLLTNVGNVDKSPAIVNDPQTAFFVKSDTSLEELIGLVEIVLSKRSSS